jgi:hypothetical protein
MAKFKLSGNYFCPVIKDEKSGYTLIIHVGVRNEARNEKTYAYFYSEDKIWMITSRDFPEYKIDKRSLKQGIQYAEIGTGLGGFIPYLVERFGARIPLPIAIDPANYAAIQKMLEFAIDAKFTFPKTKAMLRGLLERCETITNPKKVRLVNLKLEEALVQFPDLIGCSDIVVDKWGPCLCGGNTSIKQARRLLKPRGKLIISR